MNGLGQLLPPDQREAQIADVERTASFSPRQHCPAPCHKAPSLSAQAERGHRTRGTVVTVVAGWGGKVGGWGVWMGGVVCVCVCLGGGGICVYEREFVGSYFCPCLFIQAKRHKLKWYGHVTRSSGLAKTILQGTVQGARQRGRQRKRWEDNIKEWTGLEWNILLQKAENREEWRKLAVKSTVVLQRSARLRDR